MSDNYNINFLEEKLGKFDKEYQYPRTSLIEGSLFYVEKPSEDELKHEIKNIKNDESLNPTYMWGFVSETKAVHVIRTFGENRVFNFNPETMKGTEFRKGKLKILNNLDIDTFDKLFDQKAVFDYFYKKLWILRLELGKVIRNRNNIPDNIALMEAQHIIDRIIFTYFICEKELVSEKAYGSISGKELFSELIGQFPNLEAWEYLRKLFFEQFAKESADYLDFGGGVHVKTPYLNGGLFRSKDILGISEDDLVIDYDWNDIFETLNKYSWIIEDEIKDLESGYEGNLTPEIIGHIYEKFVISLDLLDEINLDELKISESGELNQGNKIIGAYYTPDYITNYMSNNTILPKLYNKLGFKKDIQFEEFINDNPGMLNDTLDVLDELKICDPACGSGAFLIEVGELILEYKTKILKKLQQGNIDRYALKKDIIINNLYGVDIKEGAVEICKLRLWLWLISSAEDKNVEPLPNIEYNFTIGNSLFGWSKENLSQSLLIQIDEKAIWALDALKAGYDLEQQKVIDNSIDLLKKTDVLSYAKSLTLLKSLYSYSSGQKAEILKKTIERMKYVIYDRINRVFLNYIASKGIRLSMDEYMELLPFHWQVDFKEVFDNGGFDVIIGNPPYVSAVTHSKNKNKERDIYRKIYPELSGAFDLYVVFLLRTLDLVDSEKIFSWIIPNKFLVADYSKNTLEKMQNHGLYSSIDVSNFDVFKNVGVYPIIILGKNKTQKLINYEIEELNDLKVNKLKLKKEIFNFKTFNDFGIKVGSGTTGFQASQIKPLIVNETEKTKNSIPFAVSGSIDPYIINTKKVRYMKSHYSYPYIKYDKNIIAESKWNFWNNEKIVIAGMTKRIEAHYSKNPLALGVGCYAIFDYAGFDPLFLLGLLNSKFLSYYLNYKFKDKHLAGGYLAINKSTILSLPLIEVSKEKQIPIAELVKKILVIKNDISDRKKKKEKIINIERKIDHIVYNLFDLSPEEIDLIEEGIVN